MTKACSANFLCWPALFTTPLPELMKSSRSSLGQMPATCAALALGYDDYSKNHAPQALAWLTKAKGDALLNEYVLFWTAQTQRVLKRNADALANLEMMQREHAGSAIREQILDVLVPAAIEAGKPQLAVEAIEAYPPTSTKPPLLLLRAEAYKSARQTARAAKDYQILFYKYTPSDESKATAYV